MDIVELKLGKEIADRLTEEHYRVGEYKLYDWKTGKWYEYDGEEIEMTEPDYEGILQGRQEAEDYKADLMADYIY